MEDRERRASRSIEGYGREGWEDTVRELASPDLVYEETGTGRRADGIDAVLTGLRAWKEAVPDVSGEVLRVVSTGDTTALEIVWRGTHTGPLTTVAGTVPPTGKSLQIHATMWQRWDGDRIVHERHHLDTAAMLSQLGMLAVPASA